MEHKMNTTARTKHNRTTNTITNNGVGANEVMTHVRAAISIFGGRSRARDKSSKYNGRVGRKQCPSCKTPRENQIEKSVCEVQGLNSSPC
jgi:hypothetical protein